MTGLHVLIEAVQWLFVVYFLGLTTVYVSLNVMAYHAMRKEKVVRATALMPKYFAGTEPGITLLVPAYNEEAVITASVRSMLQLDYPAYQVVVVNDGSKDKTMEVLLRDFDFEPYPMAYHMAIPVQRFRAAYRSRAHPNLLLIDKDNGGKADAMNAAINAAKYPLVCAVDADSVLQPDSLGLVVRPFLEDRTVIAAGGTIRIANGCSIKRGFLDKVDMPKNWVARFQVVEYLRAFLFGRLGWSPMNALLIISGAFGVFRRQVMVEMGGFNHKTIGEDMELTTRMHREMRAKGKPYRIVYVPESVCWTEAPEDLKVLKSQRVRWQRGLLETMWVNRKLLFARGSGAPGWLAYPVFLFFEAMGPVFEVLGLATLLIAAATGGISPFAFVCINGLVMALGLMLSSSALLLEEDTFHTYPRKRHLLILLGVMVIENIGYRQLNSWWRMLGFWKWARGKPQVWGLMTRKGLGT